MSDPAKQASRRGAEEAGRSPSTRQRRGQLSGTVGIGINLLLAAGKLAAGWLSGSLAVAADGLNNLTDVASSVVTLAGFHMAGHKADKEHPFGHGRAEYIAGLIVSLLILLVGLELGKSSVERILHPSDVTLTIWTAGVMALAVLAKLWMWRFNLRLSRELQSQTLAAAAIDALSDSAATAAVLAGTALGQLTGRHVDGWLGLAVAAFILWSGFQAVRGTLDPLLGRPASPELTEEIARLVLEQEEILGIHELLVHEYGPGHLFATIHAEVRPDLPLLTAHAAADRAERAVAQRLGVQAVIHIDPQGGDSEAG